MKKNVTLELISKQIEQGFAAVADDISAIKEDITDIKSTMATKSDIAHLEKGQEKIREQLEPLSRAYDKDSVTILDHSRRISRIEKRLPV